MKLFRSRRFDASARHRQIYSAYEIAYSTIDLLAAILFIVGSVLFLNDDTVTAGTWLFIIGSVFFAARPAVRLARELHLARLDLGRLGEEGLSGVAETAALDNRSTS
ncbi:YrhK family protein [Thalassospira tepidiphila]|uniref:YrhK family protein n=1 Tax=Thalassospira tepidiphila TaxID=393657 RepID=UPI003AA9B6A8